MRPPLLMLDLCCGLKGASAAMTERGWEVVTVDIDPRFQPTVVADLLTWSWRGRRPDLIWASPVCTEFSRESMPWCRTGKPPDMRLVEACVRIVRECQPRFWLLENVQGAIPWFKPLLGEPRYRMRPMFLWGAGPVTFQPPSVRIWKKQHTGSRSDLKSMIPWHLSLALARAVESDRGDRRRRASTSRGENGRAQLSGAEPVAPRGTPAPPAEPRRAPAAAAEPGPAAAAIARPRATPASEGEQRHASSGGVS